MKCEASQELVVGGFTDPQGARVGLGALLVGYYDKEDLVFAARSAPASTPSCCSICAGVWIGSKSTRRRSPSRRACRAARALGQAVDRRAGRVHRVDRHNKLRHPRLIGVRFDKKPRDVVRRVVITHPEKSVSRRRHHQGRPRAYYERSRR
jgi:bifunctional non-homologous end joining protein LigD